MDEATLTAALRDFVERIAVLDPGGHTSHSGPHRAQRASGEGDPARPPTAIEVRIGAADPVRLTGSVAEAFGAALRSYHDPRDRGRCDQCGGRRLDEALQCLDCGQPGGLFGQLVRERMSRHQP